MIKGKVCIDDPADDRWYIVPPTEAWISDWRWNGWAVPYFDKDRADAVAAAYNQYAEKCTDDDMKDTRITYDPQKDCYVLDSISERCDCAPFEEFPGEDFTIDGKQVRLYGIGAASFTWDSEEREEAK